MPLKIVPPRKGKTPNFSIRGTYLGVRVDKSCGTHKRSVARTRLVELEGQIERGEYPPREPESRTGEPTFLTAAVGYMEAGRRRRYVARLIKHFGETLLTDIDQPMIDKAAIDLHPNASPATRNACVYTPIAAILHHAGIDLKVKRPKGAKGRIVTDHLSPADATAIIAAAGTVDRELSLLLTFLLYTGARLGETLALTWERVNLDDGTAWIPITKNGDPRALRFHPELLTALAGHRGTRTAGRVFRFRQGGHLKHMLTRAKLAALGLPCPVRRPEKWRAPPNRFSWVNFHTFRHTFATWMRRYGGADLQGLVATGNWRDPRSAARYAHVVPREEWSRVDALPSVKVG